MTTLGRLPVATTAQVRRYAWRLMRADRWSFGVVVGLHALAAVAALGLPWLIGLLVQSIQDGTTSSTVDKIAAGIAGFVVAQAVLMRFAKISAARLGERVLARLREEFVDRALGLPLPTVERAGTGDLLSRTTRDVNDLGYSVRSAVPEVLVALVTALATVAALLLVSPLLTLVILTGVPMLLLGSRWYLRRAHAGYLRQSAANADLTDGLAETVEGARTIEALESQRRRVERTDADIRRSYRAERYTLRLRTVFFPVIEIGDLVPVAAMLLAGGWCYAHGWVTLFQVTAATLYARALIDPVDTLLIWVDDLQKGQAALARVLGVGNAGESRTAEAASPPLGGQLAATDVHYSYVDGRDVLHGVTLTVAVGERLAIVGPSGAGKSTLGRLLAGVDAPRSGAITVGGVPLVELPLTDLRRQVALVTQEHHVFVGTLHDNVALARPSASADEVRSALSAVDAWSWASTLPEGLDTQLGPGNLSLSPAQAQQVALARLVIADPHTLVLDEATSLIDPRAARHLERSLAAVLQGRTVIAIAHRLHSAHDADRVVVVDDGRIVELGSHHELIERDGAYAALWRSWHGGVRVPAQGTAPETASAASATAD